MVSMGEEPSREPDPFADDVHGIVRRLDARRSLPPVPSGPPALGPPSVVAAAPGRREPPFELGMTPSRIYVTLELPGASKETLEVTATDARLVVRAHGPKGRAFHAEVDLPALADPEAVTATYRNRVPDIALARRGPSRGPNDTEG